MPTIKLAVIGASGVGKTSLRGKYVNAKFSEGYRATIGADFITKVLPNSVNPNSDPVTLQIWDTAGQERFSSLSSAFFRGADACLLMFDVNSPATLISLTKWWQDFCDNAPVYHDEMRDFCVVVAGNKTDLAEDTLAQGRSVVSKEEAQIFLDELIPPVHTSNGHGMSHSHSPEPILEDIPTSAATITPDAPTQQNGVAFPSQTPPKTASIAIQPSCPPRRTTLSLSPNGRSSSKARSRSSTGTVATMHSGLSIYHTPSSSLFESYHSARSSPDLGWSRPSSPGGGASSSRLGRRTPTLSSGSLATLTPSLFARQRQEYNELSTTMLKPPDQGPRLFLTSAKTGDNVNEIFEYIAERIVRRTEWEDRTMQFSDDNTRSSILRIGMNRRGRDSSFSRMGVGCCT